MRIVNLRTRLVVAAAAVLLAGSGGAGAEPSTPAQKPKVKILHVMSYHTPWRWTEWQWQGFKDALGDIPAEYKVFEMDTKRNNSPEAKERKGREARELIEAWKPDLLYTTDDDAQEYVAKHYVGSALPIVFSGVNKDPKTYGFTGSRNVSGVLEHEHFVESVRLLRAMVPQVKRIAVVLDEAPMWEPVVARMRAGIRQEPDVSIVAWDVIRTFDEYQRRIRTYPEIADAIALIGIFHFKDAAGRNVPYQDVLRWTAENSTLPDLGFWIDRVHHGTLAAVTVSEREQGLAAGRIARAILAEGRSPSSIPMMPTVKGIPVISLPRAAKLGIPVKSGVLLSAEVIERFDWERKK
jgi:ABC-type uncharacterized transport system substrate-binding protein